MHIPVSLICAVAKQLADTFTAMAITGIARAPTNFMKVHVSFLTYWAIVGITYAFEHYQRYRERELQAAHLQTALARAQVQSLQMQLHPHFLFNTLNAIAALMREDVEAADVMIARLGDLLRVTLATADVPEVPLAPRARVRRHVSGHSACADGRPSDDARVRGPRDPRVPGPDPAACSHWSRMPSATARRAPRSDPRSRCAPGATAICWSSTSRMMGRVRRMTSCPATASRTRGMRLAAAYGPSASVDVTPRRGGGRDPR